MIDTLAADVAIPTGQRHAPGLARFAELLRDRFTALGASWEPIPGDPAPDWLREGHAAASGEVPSAPPMFIARRIHPRPAAKVLLCGHYDTVHDPAGPFQRLTISQDARTATGPGCADMKGGLLVALFALEALAATNVPVEWTFAIISDEETGTFHADRALRDLSNRCADEGYAAGLVFEPALPDGGLVIERPGSGQFMIECAGRAAHVGRDFANGVSAVQALAEAIVSAGHIADPAQGLILSIGPLEGGQATNIVPDRARAWGNVRCFTPVAQARAVERLLALERNHNTLPSTRVQSVFNRPAKPSSPRVMQLAALARDCQRDLYAAGASQVPDLPFAKTGGVCDGNNIQAATDHRLPVIDTLGVRGGGLHTTDEWIELDSLVDRAQLVALLIERIASGALAASAEGTPA
jgi:glutamate carboxypeptidase